MWTATGRCGGSRRCRENSYDGGVVVGCYVRKDYMLLNWNRECMVLYEATCIPRFGNIIIIFSYHVDIHLKFVKIEV